jgi:2-(1,2-epoxy-1,2-dihydrophenyl)acetyl-CoA isomerase
MQKAKEMAFFGEKLSAAAALTLGLVNRVVNAADLDATVDDFAGRLAGAPTSAIAFTKRLLNDSPDTDRSGAFVAEAMSQEIQSYSHDSKEGVQAFMEKRPTEFTGW